MYWRKKKERRSKVLSSLDDWTEFPNNILSAAKSIFNSRPTVQTEPSDSVRLCTYYKYLAIVTMMTDFHKNNKRNITERTAASVICCAKQAEVYRCVFCCIKWTRWHSQLHLLPGSISLKKKAGNYRLWLQLATKMCVFSPSLYSTSHLWVCWHMLTLKTWLTK